MPEMATNQLTRQLLRRLPPRIVQLLRELGRSADEKGIGLYLVGGVVTKKEWTRIHAAQDKASKKIYRQKHDRQKSRHQ